MTLTNRIVWFHLDGATKRGRVMQDDESSRYLPVITLDANGSPYVQIVPFGELRFRAPREATNEQPAH